MEKTQVSNVISDSKKLMLLNGNKVAGHVDLCGTANIVLTCHSPIRSISQPYTATSWCMEYL